MTSILAAIYAHDSVNDFFVLHEVRQGKLCAKKAYEDLVCQKCKKIDEKAALRRGVEIDGVVKSRRPFLGSAEDFYVVDERCKMTLSSLLPDEVEYFPLPPSHWVASARICLQPNPEDPGFRCGRDRCRECGRFREVVWGKSPPRIPFASRFVAVNLESIRGAREVWLVAQDIAESLRKVEPALTGLVLSPKEVEIISND
jgi:hypothetical protein